LPFGRLVWHTSVIIGDLPCCRWIYFVEIFLTLPTVSLSKLWCASKIFFICLFSLSSLLLVICEERGEKNIGNTSKLRWRHHRHCWKNLDETNPTIPKKVTNGDWSAPHELFEEKWALTHLDILCGILWSSFLAFLGVIAIFLFISFQRY
jgi:hypothetical protein